MRVFSVRDLNQHTGEVLDALENGPVFITKRGQFIAVIHPLRPGDVQRRVLKEIAEETGPGSEQAAEATRRGEPDDDWYR